MSDAVATVDLTVWAGEAHVGTISKDKYDRLLRDTRKDAAIRIETALFYAGVAIETASVILQRSIAVVGYAAAALVVWAAFANPSLLSELWTVCAQATSSDVAKAVRPLFVVSVMLTMGASIGLGSRLTRKRINPMERRRKAVLAGLFNVPDPNRIRVTR